MDKKLVLAVAGSGKTYYICQMLVEDEKNLILAFTHENIKNIRNEIIKRFGYIPEKTCILTVNDTLRMYKNDDIRMYNFDCITDTIVEVITTCNTYTLLTVHLL